MVPRGRTRASWTKWGGKWQAVGGETADAAQKPGTARLAGPLASGAAVVAGTTVACAPDPRRRLVVLGQSRQGEKVCCAGGHGGIRRGAAST
jgi:hypothetical protein